MKRASFNTSYVKVQLSRFFLLVDLGIGFNTSYVKVQRVWRSGRTLTIRVSIHLMLRFNAILPSLQYAVYSVSIHLMLRFNAQFPTALIRAYQSFNTSYVKVQLRARNRRSSQGLVSIHLMLRFNRKGKGSRIQQPGVSIHLMLRFNVCPLLVIRGLPFGFNTSYVKVQQHHSLCQRRNFSLFQYILC